MDLIADTHIGFPLDQPYTYQALHLAELTRRLDLRGKNVLEIGGCLPRQLALGLTGARRWIGTDMPGYWAESGDDNPSQHYDAPSFPILQARETEALDYALLLGDILDLPVDCEPFDAIFSSCAFEHICDLGKRLHVIQQVMRPGALLLAVAMPVWSSPHGSHLLPMNDEAGNLWLPEALGLPDWHQLLWTAEEMAAHLTSKSIPSEIIAQAVEWVHRSKHLNRLFAGDYRQIALSSGFAESQILYSDRIEWANTESMAALNLLYPDKGPFDRAGVMMILKA